MKKWKALALVALKLDALHNAGSIAAPREDTKPMLRGLRQKARREAKVIVANLSDRLAPTRAPDGLPIPPRAFRDMVRVGDHSAKTFLEQGKSVARAIQDAAASVGSPIKRSDKVFEWGCGCGRVIRHLVKTVDYLAGCDVDPDLVGWVQDNIDRERFFTSAYLPPLPIEADTFDVVYSISVFTHIDQLAGDFWINELSRITRPGGLIIVSVLAAPDADSFRIQERNDRGIKRSWLGAEGAPDKYMDTRVNVPWLVDRWSGSVTLKSHLPGGIRGKQDILVFEPTEG